MKIVLMASLMGAATLCVSNLTAQAEGEPSTSTAKHEIGVGLTGGEAVLANIRYGYNINKNFRFEAEASTGTVIENGSGFIFSDDDINYWVSGFGVARLPYGSNNSAVFVRAGVGASKSTAQAFTSQTPIFGPTGVSYPELSANGVVIQGSLGVEHFFTQKFGLRLEGTYANDSSFDEISDAVGREPRETSYTMIGASAVVRF